MTHNQQQKKWQSQYGPWAVVTGASSGIGRAMACQLAAAGLNLVLVARSQNALNELATDLSNQFGIETQVVAVDLANETGVQAVKNATQRLDCGLFVAAAGFGTSGQFLNTSIDDELAMLNVNCRALMRLSLTFGRRFADRGKGGLILMSSIVGFQGMPNAAHYAATKAYVQTFAEALHVELKPLGIGVLASAPGPTNSGFADRADMQMNGAMEPADVAKGTLNALGRKTTVLPGFLSKVLVYSLATLPRWARIRIMGQVMHGMIKHQQVPLPKSNESLKRG